MDPRRCRRGGDSVHSGIGRDPFVAALSTTLEGPTLVTRTFKIGDHVSWNSEAGHVSGTIIKVHKRDFDWKGYTHHASSDDPQYEIKSDKTDHVAVHKGSALKKVHA
jgi:hypothetical protein